MACPNNGLLQHAKRSPSVLLSTHAKDPRYFGANLSDAAKQVPLHSAAHISSSCLIKTIAWSKRHSHGGNISMRTSTDSVLSGSGVRSCGTMCPAVWGLFELNRNCIRGEVLMKFICILVIVVVKALVDSIIYCSVLIYCIFGC